MIESDHKSQEQISIKNLADAPICLQRMLLWLQDYDFTINYCPREKMVKADTSKDTPEILLDISVNHIYIDAEKKENIMRIYNNLRWPTTMCPWRDDHHWMARWYQRCSKSIMTIPWTMWYTHYRGWTYPTWRSNHCSSMREEVGLGTDPSIPSPA